MRRLNFEIRALCLLATGFGLALWMPAVGLPTGIIPLQPMDLLAVVGLPLIIVFRAQLTPTLLVVVAILVLSFSLSLWVGGALPIFLYYTVFILPFIVAMGLIATLPQARDAFIRAFVVGGILSLLLFLAQIAFGADALDFRTNLLFRLPPQYGRGFALFPEVSTFATHAILFLGACLVMALHPNTRPGQRPLAVALVFLALVALMFTRSSSVLVIAPLIVLASFVLTTRLTLSTLIMVLLLSVICALILAFFLSAFYADRLENASAARSMAMRFSSVLGGLSPFTSGELFGVGLGNNDLVRVRAYEASRAFGLATAQLPEGINSLVVSRLFEEGWPALAQSVLSLGLLVRIGVSRAPSPAVAVLAVLAIGSFLIAFLVTGYRGIYTNWLWIALPPAFFIAEARTKIRNGSVCAAT